MFHRAIQSAIKPWRRALVVQHGKAGQFRVMSSSASEDDELFTDSDDNNESNFSYGVRKTTEWFKEKDIKNAYRLCKVLDPTVKTGIYVDFPHGLTLSVETHPLACMSDFAETVIMPTSDTEKSMSDLDDEDDETCSSRLIALAPLGYDEDCTLKHREPEDLFDHIVKFNQMLKTAKTVDGVVHLASGESIDLSGKSKAGKEAQEKKSDTHIYVKSNFKF